MTSFVPIQLFIEKSDSSQKIVLWQNPRPSSTRYCRPIKFQFIHETPEICNQEKEYIDKQISCLENSKITINGKDLSVRHKLLFTMVDGKVCNSITGTKSALQCYICGLTSRNFNDLEKVKTTNIDHSNLDFGLSVLHGWVRFFESLLHLSYKLPIRKWQVREKNEKEIVSSRKSLIQKKFRNEIGLIVDRPKPGFGSSNDGNTARRFFENAEVSASITGIDINIIRKFRNIMCIISSGYEINLELFKSYLHDTAKLYVKEYPWYPMPTTVHKILMHGQQVIKNALLPIGQLSEEAQEAMNKDFKNFRQGYSRKMSRVKTNEDILHWLLLSSDPLISTTRNLPKHKLKYLNKKVQGMIKATDIFIKNFENGPQNCDEVGGDFDASSEEEDCLFV